MKHPAAPSESPEASFKEAAEHVEAATAAKKCWPCGCFHDTLKAIENAVQGAVLSPRLISAVEIGKAALTERKYDCLGCEICWPALAMNAMGAAGADVEAESCPADAPPSREGWPPLPGDYAVVRYRAPVAICTLNSHELVGPLAVSRENGVSIVGTLRTENLGIERLIANVAANPNIRFLVLCGEDSSRAIGHLPGQSLLSLGRSGLDERGRIPGALGKRPVLKNISSAIVEHFRQNVELVDLIGVDEPEKILRETLACAERSPGPAAPYPDVQGLRPVAGYLPKRMVSDPAGYFVIYPDRQRGVLSLEHYTNGGVLDCIVEGRTAAELYMPAIEKNLVSKLDHASYLGKELARAEASLASGALYVQDAAPEQSAAKAGCTSC